MASLLRPKEYQSISTTDSDEGDAVLVVDGGTGEAAAERRPRLARPSSSSSTVYGPWSRAVAARRPFLWVGLAAVAGALCVLAAFALGHAVGYGEGARGARVGAINTTTAAATTATATATAGSCSDPEYRKEWRTLSRGEKKAYLDAVHCFVSTPSRFHAEGTLYDDFSWVHNKYSHGTHGFGPFLTWHRRFIFIYEKTIRQVCSYNGSLPYWDWSLDWEDLAHAPVFSSELGFGGDGDKSGVRNELGGYCVTDGPFKDLRPMYFADWEKSHCLTRHFAEDFYGEYLGPAAVQKVMAAKSYEQFFLALERGPHDIIPIGAGGDFMYFTAPNDPLFYLHHAQLDRLWWLWQQRDRAVRLTDYSGKSNDSQPLGLDDVLPMSGLDRDVTVLDIMDTEGGDMCYRYMEI